MKLSTQTLTQVIDAIDEGIILLDAEHRIQFINDKAKLITGILVKSTFSHDSGQINQGDIVIFISNKLGEDDGDLTPECLSTLGINDTLIQTNDTLMGIGIYDNQTVKPTYKLIKESEILDKIQLEDRFFGHDINSTLDFQSKTMSIGVDHMTFTQNYAKTFGHIVVIDGQSGHIKFFQEKGYSLRSEAIGDLLRGLPFMAKGQTADEDLTPRMIGRPFDQFFDAPPLIEALSRDQSDSSLFIDLNRRPVYCSIVKESHHALIKFRDLSEMNALLDERESILSQIDDLKRQTFSQDELMALKAFEPLTGHSQVMRQIKIMAYKAAKVHSNVLITGESGTGKTLLAQLIHQNSGRLGNFVSVNCAAIPATLFESELFGYEKGAFTGANQTGKIGYFEQAEGGTLFLDEIGEIPLDIQAKLLQVLQSKSFYRLGATKPKQVNVRIITATNIDLFDAVDKGYFRQDLYYRINVFGLHLPPLRERKEDLYALIKQRTSEICQSLNLPKKQLTSDAFNLLKHYGWPGNIRELENVLERAIAVTDYPMISPETIKVLTRGIQEAPIKPLKEQLEDAERTILLAAIEKSETKADAMKKLGCSKSTFYEKCHKYGL